MKGEKILNELIITKQNGQPVVSSRQVAENFGKEHKHVLENIREILKAENSALTFFYESSYKVDGNNKSYPEYLMNRDGFTLLAMGFTGADAMQWKIKYIQAFNEMERQLTAPLSQLEILAQAAQALLEQDKAIKQIAATQTQLFEAQSQQSAELQGIRDIVALNPNDWRKETTAMICKIAQKLGGSEYIRRVHEDSYKLLDVRFGVDLQCRLTNKRNRMAGEGICKSKRDKLNQLDVIGDDKKLIEGYVAIIKEMAIKYGV